MKSHRLFAAVLGMERKRIVLRTQQTHLVAVYGPTSRYYHRLWGDWIAEFANSDDWRDTPHTAYHDGECIHCPSAWIDCLAKAFRVAEEDIEHVPPLRRWELVHHPALPAATAPLGARPGGVQ